MTSETNALARHIIAVEEIAQSCFDGHYSILKFTTHYKGAFGTPDHMWPETLEDAIAGHCPFDRMPTFQSIDALLVHLIHDRPIFDKGTH